VDPIDIDPEGAQRARTLADKKSFEILRMRVAALALVVVAGVVLIRMDAAVQALWVLPAIPLFFSADLRLGGLVESYSSFAAQHENGSWKMASVDEILRGGYRSEYYGLLAAAVVAVAVRG
jgi:hypothetical protein